MRLIFLLVILFIAAGNIHAADNCEIDNSYKLNDLTSLFTGQAEDVQASSCFIDGQTVNNSNINYQWIDVRPEQDFANVHINGSINLPPHIIKTKNYLKQRPLLILDHGASYRRLLRLCSELKQAGFEQVNILKGGINAAVASGQSVHGSRHAAVLTAINPKMAMEEFYLGGIIFVAGDENDQQLLAEKKLPIQLVRQRASEDDFFAQLEKIHGQSDVPSVLQKSIIVVSTTGHQHYGVLDHNKLSSRVYFLEGGVQALLNFLETTAWSNFNRMTIPNRFSCQM
ncbi:MAG: rhodanese-related sulfurtransferase [Cellvibrionaceae bacterium]|jgi:rhodanese-related sulfurtransferase